MTPSPEFLRRAEAAVEAGDVGALRRLAADTSGGEDLLHPTHARVLAAALVRATRRRAAQQLPDGAPRPVWRRAWWDSGSITRPIAALDAGGNGGEGAGDEGEDETGTDSSGGAAAELERLQRFQRYLVRSAMAAADAASDAELADGRGPSALALAAVAGCVADLGWRKPEWVPFGQREQSVRG